MKRYCVACVLLLFLGASLANSQNSSSQSQAATAQAKNSAQSGGVPSASEIAAAKASHKVWVNLDTGVYHKGGRWYGKTKNGKFMTVDDAKKAGYKPAKRD